MCLIKRFWSFLPYNRSKYRWKIMSVNNRLGDEHLFLMSLHQYFGWTLNKWEESYDRSKFWNKAAKHDVGFHVFLENKMVEATAFGKSLVFAKIEVQGFIASGYWSFDRTVKEETWKKARVVQVFNLKGEDITQKLAKIS